MNYLVLINGAPKYKYYFAEIAKSLEAKGHTVFFAVNSRKSTIMEPLDYIDNSERVFFFDDFANYNKVSIEKLPLESTETWGDVFYADFDRFFCHNYNLLRGNEYWKNIYNSLEYFFEKVLKENAIDCILYENVSNSFAYMAYQVATKLNIKYLGLMVSRIPDRYEIHTSIYGASLEIEKFAQMGNITQIESDWFDNYQKSLMHIQPDYMKNNVLNRKITLLNLIHPRKILTVKKYIQAYLRLNSYFDFQSGPTLLQMLTMYKYSLVKRKNERVTRNYYLSTNEVDELLKQNEKFYVYPTHYHPEASTSIYAADYTNEFNNIINIHNNLPVGTYLYVKDHISARGVQNKEFYRKVVSLPGVRLINFNYNVKKLILRSQGVITVTSTVGYEAAIMNKPVFLFGRVFYENFANVYKLASFHDLRNLTNIMASIDNHRPLYDIKMWVIAYFRFCFEGKLLINEPKKWSHSYFDNLTDNIINKMHEV